MLKKRLALIFRKKEKKMDWRIRPNDRDERRQNLRFIILPETPVIAKGWMYNGEVIFGTIFVASDEQKRKAICDDPKVDAVSQNFVGNILSKETWKLRESELNKRLNIQDGWKLYMWPTPDIYRTAAFVEFSIKMPHNIDLPKIVPVFGDSPGVRHASLRLLSGYLLKGEALNLRNFAAYEVGLDKNFDFLPIVIESEHFIFYSYKPTFDTLAKCAKLFESAVPILETLKPHLVEVVKRIDDYVQLLILAKRNAHLLPVIEQARNDLEEILLPFKGKLGFAYQSLAGTGAQKSLPFPQGLIKEGGIIKDFNK
jgi:hypothetical protein